jgi:hypothetical protein
MCESFQAEGSAGDARQSAKGPERRTSRSVENPDFSGQPAHARTVRNEGAVKSLKTNDPAKSLDSFSRFWAADARNEMTHSPRPSLGSGARLGPVASFGEKTARVARKST